MWWRHLHQPGALSGSNILAAPWCPSPNVPEVTAPYCLYSLHHLNCLCIINGPSMLCQITYPSFLIRERSLEIWRMLCGKPCRRPQWPRAGCDLEISVSHIPALSSASSPRIKWVRHLIGFPLPRKSSKAASSISADRGFWWDNGRRRKIILSLSYITVFSLQKSFNPSHFEVKVIIPILQGILRLKEF